MEITAGGWFLPRIYLGVFIFIRRHDLWTCVHGFQRHKNLWPNEHAKNCILMKSSLMTELLFFFRANAKDSRLPIPNKQRNTRNSNFKITLEIIFIIHARKKKKRNKILLYDKDCSNLRKQYYNDVHNINKYCVYQPLVVSEE